MIKRIKKSNFKQALIAFLLITPLQMKGEKSSTSELILTLEEAITIALEKNYENLISEAEFKSAQSDYRQTHALFIPGIELSHSVAETNDPLAAFGYKLQQQRVIPADFNPTLLNNPERIKNYHTQILIQQPLINVDEWFGRSAAKSKMVAMQLKSERTKDFLKFSIKQGYFGLQLVKEKKQVLQKAYEATKANYKLTEDNLKQGIVKDADLLAMKVRLLEAENQIKDAEDEIKRANEGLSYLLGLPDDIRIVPVDPLQLTGIINADKFLSGIERRPDVEALSLARDARKKMVQSNKAKLIPKMNAFGVYNLNDNVLFGSNAKSWMVGATLTWKVFDGNKNLAFIKKAKAELEIAENEYQKYVARQKREFEQANRNVQLAASKLDATKLAKESAEESFRIRQNRFAEGLEKTSDVIAAEAIKSSKQLEYLYMQYQYNVAVFYLEFLMKKED